ncbi:MAG: type I methionyl aminopeptidase [candidate division FCPU426 bacterium]
MIELKGPAEILKMRAAGRIIGALLEEFSAKVKPGVSTGELDLFARRFIEAKGALPTFLGYQGYPATICASVNEEVVHGIPGPRKLAEGDIIGIDVGATLDGWVADAARTYAVGKIGPEARQLIDATREALDKGLDQARDGNHLQDIGFAVQSYVEPKGFSVVRDFVGHGIGRKMHESPQIPNYGKKGLGLKIKKGMAFAIEPMINRGAYQVKVLGDGWTVVTRDGSLSAHFEDTIIVSDGAPEIMTRLS